MRPEVQMVVDHSLRSSVLATVIICEFVISALFQAQGKQAEFMLRIIEVPETDYPD
jgi:hypothetical protein